MFDAIYNMWRRKKHTRTGKCAEFRLQARKVWFRFVRTKWGFNVDTKRLSLLTYFLSLFREWIWKAFVYESFFLSSHFFWGATVLTPQESTKKSNDTLHTHTLKIYIYRFRFQLFFNTKMILEFFSKFGELNTLKTVFKLLL